MRYAMIVTMFLLSFSSITFADTKDFSGLKIYSKTTNTRNEIVAGTSADGVTIYQGRKGGYYWKDTNGKKHYIKTK